jgi:hypothetical protein
MPYAISWYVQDRIIKTHLSGVVTDAELIRSVEEIEAQIQQATPPVFLLIDFRDVTEFPRSFNSVLKEMGLRRSTGQSAAWTILLAHNSFFKFFGLTASKVMNVPVAIFEAEEQVEAFIRRHAPDLEPVLASKKAMP